METHFGASILRYARVFPGARANEGDGATKQRAFVNVAKLFIRRLVINVPSVKELGILSIRFVSKILVLFTCVAMYKIVHVAILIFYL